MWSNKFTSQTAAAILVVSDNGDILSPKYAPDIIAPATIPVGIPIAVPIPKNAIPTVAIVLHELPVANDIIAEIIATTNRKLSGFNIFNP